MHAQIKLLFDIEDGTYHVFTSPKLNNYVQRTAVIQKLSNNSYFAHREAIIVGCLGEKLVLFLFLWILSYEALVAV